VEVALLLAHTLMAIATFLGEPSQSVISIRGGILSIFVFVII